MRKSKEEMHEQGIGFAKETHYYKALSLRPTHQIACPPYASLLRRA
jgi:hypothetical protein